MDAVATTISSDLPDTANGGEASLGAVRMALAMATYLDQIRQIYGDECANFVSSMWLESSSPRWEEATHNALKRWTAEHPRFVLDLDF